MEPTTGMAALNTALLSAISTDTMLANLTVIVPFVGGLAIFAFIYRIIRRSVGGASKGKAKI